MQPINPKLLERLKAKTGLSTSQVYRRVDQKSQQTHLPRHLAALALAAELKININRFASSEDFAAIRGAGNSSAPNLAPPLPTVRIPPAKPSSKTSKRASPKKRRGNSVFVVHGRNESLRKAMFSFLRALGLNPIEWRKAIQVTGKASPYVGEVLEAAFREAVAVVVLLTPDDEARLKEEFQRPSDPLYERELMGQARANVLFEAGMAFGREPESVVLVQVGELRPFSDVGGRHVVHLTNATEQRLELITKLANAGCNVDTSGTDWATEGDFTVERIANG